MRQRANNDPEEEGVPAGDSDPFGEEPGFTASRPPTSRLAGRLGVRERGKRAHSDNGEDRSKVPSLREGKDLRDLLNGDPSAVKDEAGQRRII